MRYEDAVNVTYSPPWASCIVFEDASGRETTEPHFALDEITHKIDGAYVVKTWTPCIKSLIKMQIEHDARQEGYKRENKNVKLRLDFFLSLGLKLVKWDEFTVPTRTADGLATEDLKVVHDTENANNAWERDNECFVVSLAPRKNTGALPCGDDVPVVVDIGTGRFEMRTLKGYKR